MLGKGKRGVVQVQADKLHKVEAHGALGSLGHVGVQKVGSRLLAALADGVHERHDRGLDLVANASKLLAERPRSYWSSQTSYGSRLGSMSSADA